MIKFGHLDFELYWELGFGHWDFLLCSLMSVISLKLT